MKMALLLLVSGAALLNIPGCFCQVNASVCGKAALNTKIIGGEDATSGSWPWQVSIQKTDTKMHFCGGSLINTDWVLTSAHVLKGIPASQIYVLLGTVNLRNPATTINVSQIIIHPNYTDINNDIALVRLSSPVTFSDTVAPVCLASAGSIFAAGTESWIAGWGVLQATDNVIPSIMQEVEIPVVDNMACRTAYEGVITDSMMCAGNLSSAGKAPCNGDEGSPLVIQQGPQWIQAGVYIVSMACGSPKYPAIFTRVSDYETWINSQIKSDQPGFVSFPNNDYVLGGGVSHLHSFALLTFSVMTLFFCLFY